MGNLRFAPVQGTEKKIRESNKVPGKVSFATDSGRIFLDLDTENRISMGGAGASVFLGDEQNVKINPDNTYELSLDSLGDNFTALKQNDIIINSDGRFFKVDSIKDGDTAVCSLLAVSGSGGNGPSGGGESSKISLSFDPLIGKNFVYKQPYFVSFTPSAQTDTEVTVQYEIFGSNNQYFSATIENIPTGKVCSDKMDLGSNLFLGLNKIIITVSSDNDGSYSYEFSNRNSIEMKLTKSSDFNPGQFIDSSTFSFICNVSGDVNKELIVYIDGTEVARKDIGSASGRQSIIVGEAGQIPPHKSCVLSAVLREKANGVLSNTLEYEIAWVNPANNTIPVIWLKEQPKEIVNYSELLIEYLVYDPTTKNNVGELGETTVLLQINDQSPIERTLNVKNLIENAKWAEWNVANYIQGKNTLIIKCGDLSSKVIEVNVLPDDRKMELVNPNNLLLNLSALGRSKDEKTSRETWSFTDHTETISSQPVIKNTVFNGFNWYNNGWDGTALRISNGANISIDFPGQFVYNRTGEKTASAAFEIRFKLSNVKNYSPLIKNVTYYFVNGNKYTEEELDEKFPDGVEVDQVIDPSTNKPTGFPKVEIEKVISDEEGIFCQLYDKATKTGFALGTQEAYFTTGTKTVSVNYKEDEVITLSMVVEHYNASTGKASLLSIYLNGILSGVVQISEYFQINSENILINSDYCDVDLYSIRAYNIRLDMKDVVQNYLCDCRDINLYDENMKIFAIDQTEVEGKEEKIEEPTISYQQLQAYNNEVTDSDKLSMCYMIIQVIDNDGKTSNAEGTGNIPIDDDRLPYFKGNKRKCRIEFHNPSLDDAFKKGTITDNYIYYLPSFESDNVELNVQGTSSQGYPRRNYKAKLKSKKLGDGTTKLYAKYLEGPQKGEYFKKLYLDNDSCCTDTFTWKIDYMESSSCHNTGLANLMDTMYTKHPMAYYSGFPDPKEKGYRTTVYGVPVLVFQQHTREGKPITDSYQFIGKYNFNLDKGSNEYYGYEDKSIHPFVKGPNGEDIKICDIAESWEFRNNQGLWTSFKLPNGVNDFNSPIVKDGDNKGLQEFIEHFEYRYSNDEDNLDIAYEYVKKPKDEYKETFATVADVNEFLKEKHKNFRKMFMWVNSTDIDGANDLRELPDGGVEYLVTETYMKLILEDIIKDGKIDKYKDVYQEEMEYFKYNQSEKKMIKYEFVTEDKESEFESNKSEFLIKYDEKLSTRNETQEYSILKHYTHDTVEYRLTKFKQEFKDHFNLEYCLIYFIMTELLIMFDSRGKNMFLSSWGPDKEGGDYIWFPVFYDMDTQLGVNNTGIPTYDYDIDATENNAFSTGNSVLWKNFYTCFIKEIKTKYRDLRSSVLTKEKIENSYNFSPETYTNSYAMKGSRPLIIHNVDEYYKYLAPMYSGYRNTSGDKKFDSGSFLYACQGTRQLQRSALLTNRLNYIDSWWNAGQYRTDSTSSTSLWMRVNYNDTDTSDLFLEREPTAEETSKGFIKNPNSPALNPFDSRPEFNIKTYLKQYSSVGYDAIYTDPVKCENVAASPVPPISIQDSFKNTVGVPDQLVYIPGAEYLEDVGDLSLKYLSEFHFDYAIRAKRLQLGNDSISYKNKKMTSNRLELGDRANGDTPKPLLETVILTQLEGLNQEIDLGGSAKLKEFRALGTKIPSVVLAEGVAIETLHLPSSLSKLELVDAWGLNTVLSSKPIKDNKYLDTKGLYIEGLTDVELDDIGSLSLSSIKIEGGNLGPESYKILQKAMASKTKETDRLAISMKNVNWNPYIKVEEDEEFRSGTTYYLLTDHYTYMPLTGEDALKNNTYKKGYKKDLAYNNTIITSLDVLNECINNNKFVSTDLVAGGTKNPDITGTIFINNPASAPINDWDIKKLMTKDYYPQLKIYAENVNYGLAVKYIQEIEGQEIVKQLDLYNPYPEDEEGNDLPLIVLKPEDEPKKEHYDFKYWRLKGTTNSDFFEGSNAISLERGTQEDIVLEAYFEPHQYSITFEYENGDNVEQHIVLRTYNQLIGSPDIVPYKKLDTSDVERYGFVGFALEKYAADANPLLADFTTEKCTGVDAKYRAIFKKESVWDAVSNLSWFDFSPYENRGWIVRVNSNYINPKTGECSVQGKITLPAYYEGQPVLAIASSSASNQLDNPNGFAYNNKITHVYWYEDESKNEFLSLEIIGAHAFYKSGLKKFQFETRYPERKSNQYINQIGTSAFQECDLINTLYNIKYYGANCFNTAINTSVSSIVLTNDVQTLGTGVFYRSSAFNVIIGTEDKPISLRPQNLLTNSSITLTDNYFPNNSTVTIHCNSSSLAEDWTSYIKEIDIGKVTPKYPKGG